MVSSSLFSLLKTVVDMNRNLRGLASVLAFLFFFAGNGAAQTISLALNPAQKNQLTVTESPAGTYELLTGGIDPWINSTILPSAYNPETVFVIEFEYLAVAGLDDLEIFYGAPLSPSRTVKLGSLPATNTFTSYKVMMKFVAPVWNAFYDRFRFDFGKAANQRITVRNLKIRSALPTEVIALPFDEGNKNGMNLTANADGSYDIASTNTDPWVVANINTTFNAERVFVVSFDYIAAAGLDDLQIFYGSPFVPERRALLGSLPAVTAYRNFKTLMRTSAPSWNESYDKLRFDFGRSAGQNIKVKNLLLREATRDEYAAFDVKETVNILLDPAAVSPNLTATQLPDGSYQLDTRANDPWIRSRSITDIYNISETYILTFEYKTAEAYNDLEVFFGPPINNTQAFSAGALPAAADWTTFAINPRLLTDNFQDARRTVFRLDFGKNENATKTLFIRNIQLRKPTAAELVAEQTSDKFVSRAVNTAFTTYLNTTFAEKVDGVKVTASSVIINGSVTGAEAEYYLAEVEPHEYGFQSKTFSFVAPLSIANGKFAATLDRFKEKTDRQYDRLYSRWAVVKKLSDTEYSLLSNTTWASDIAEAAENNLPEKKASSKKGLDGLVSATLPYFSDLQDLNIKSMKLNLLLNGAFSLAPTGLTHQFNGKTYDINPSFISTLDASVKKCTENDIVVSVVLLIPINITNETVKRLFVHPDARLGLYSMGNVATEEGVEYYTAMIDFLAKRYSQPNAEFGRIDHWIIHNEVDAHESWTHAGAKPAPLYTEIYQRSMRLVHYTIRKHNPTAKVFASFTKHFNSQVGPNQFFSKEILDVLNRIGKKEGDFEWGIGWHSYPTNLFNPLVWNDAATKTPFNFNAPEITPKNIEVIDAFVRQKDLLYNGKKVRTVVLSENGFSSNTEKNPNANETTQAAALAYFWKKTNNRVPAIEGIQLHRWIDNPNEAGLLFGLWTNKPGTVTEPDRKKEGWSVWNAAGTPNEDAAFEPYKAVIGIQDWSAIQQTLATEVTPYKVTMRIKDCAGNLDALWILFNGEKKKPQPDGSVTFYNVASDVAQPYEVRKEDVVIKSGDVQVTADAELELSVAPVYNLELRVASPSDIRLTWTNGAGGEAYRLEVSQDGGAFSELATVPATANDYVHTNVTAGSEYTYRLALQSGSFRACYSPEVSIKAPTLYVEYMDEDKGQVADKQIKPAIRIINRSGNPVPLAEVTARYWLTVENPGPLRVEVNPTPVGKFNVQTRTETLDPAKEGADAYVEISFKPEAGGLAALSNTGTIELRITKKDMGILLEPNDYSYAPNVLFAPTQKITLYHNGRLIWGDEPPAASAATAVQRRVESLTDTETRSLRNVPFPNPVTSKLLVPLVRVAPVSLRVMDITGRTYRVPFHHNGTVLELALDRLPKGSYLLQVVQGGQQVQHPFIKM